MNIFVPVDFFDISLLQSVAQTILVGSVPSRPEAAKEFIPNFKDYFQVTFKSCDTI